MKTSVVLHDIQKELLSVFSTWVKKYPETLAWRKRKSYDIAWWDRAAMVCHREEVPAPLMIYLCHSYLNLRPEDAEIPFTPNVFRSESLMLRAVANFRAAMNRNFEMLEPLHLIKWSRELIPPNGLLSAARMMAELSCQYFEHTMMIRCHEWKRLTGIAAPDVVHDTIAYKTCEKHPFLLLRVAKTPRVRSIAAVNAFFTADRLPWHTPIWEGICSRNSLNHLDRLTEDEHYRKYYEGGRPQYTWPLHCLDDRKLSAIESEIPHPELNLLHYPLYQKTDFLLASKLHAVRSGLPDCEP